MFLNPIIRNKLLQKKDYMLDLKENVFVTNSRILDRIYLQENQEEEKVIEYKKVHFKQKVSKKSFSGLEEMFSKGKSNDRSFIEKAPLLAAECLKKHYGGIIKLVENFNSKHFDDVIASSLLLINQYPKLPILYNLLGASYASKDNNTLAIKYFKEAIKLDENNFEYYNNIGKSFFSLGFYDDAKLYFEKSLKIFL